MALLAGVQHSRPGSVCPFPSGPGPPRSQVSHVVYWLGSEWTLSFCIKSSLEKMLQEWVWGRKDELEDTWAVQFNSKKHLFKTPTLFSGGSALGNMTLSFLSPSFLPSLPLPSSLLPSVLSSFLLFFLFPHFCLLPPPLFLFFSLPPFLSSSYNIYLMLSGRPFSQIPLYDFQVPPTLTMFLNQAWVRLPARSKANLLTLGCREGKCGVYCRAPSSESR